MRFPTRIPPIRSASSNRSTSARSAAGTAVRARVASASDAVRPSATMFRMSAINPTRADRMARSASLDLSRRQGPCGPRPACARPRARRAVFAARPRLPTCRRWAETTAIRHPTRAPQPDRHLGQRDDVHALVVQLRGIGDVLKDPLLPRLDLRRAGAGERPDRSPLRPGGWPPRRQARSAWSRSRRTSRCRD